ncbi:MAG TPA: histidine kinase dimerization/phospho-acceptor domain-containing protein, partial [Ktedonobacteraceae bacterium]
MWLRETQARYWKQARHAIGDSLWKRTAAIDEQNHCVNQNHPWLSYFNILALWGPTLLLAIIWLHEQDSPFYFSGILLISAIATINLIFVIRWQKKAHRQAVQQTTGLLPTVLEMTEALLLLPPKASEQQEENNQSAVEDGIVEQQLLKLTCCVLECSAATVIAVDPLTNLLNPIAKASSSTDLEQHWLTHIQDTYLQDHLRPEQIRLLQSGEVILHTILRDKSRLYSYETLIAPVQLHGHLQGLFVLAYKKDKQHRTQEYIAQIKALAQTLARMLEREQRLHEHIETQAGELVLRHALRRMDESISLVSHELKTPLTAIHISAQLAQHRVKRLNTQELSDTQQMDYTHTINDVQKLLERIENQVRIQNRLIDDLLDVPRLQTDHLKLEAQRFNLAELAHEVTEELRQIAPTRPII